MIELKNPQSGFSKPFVVTAVAVCTVLVLGTAALIPLPSAANYEVSTGSTAYAGPTGYFPDEFVNQAKEIEPMPQMYE